MALEDSGVRIGCRDRLLLGAESILAGLRPGIVSALVETGTDVDGLRAAINLDAAFALLQPEIEGEPPPEADVDAKVDPLAESEREAGAD